MKERRGECFGIKAPISDIGLPYSSYRQRLSSEVRNSSVPYRLPMGLLSRSSSGPLCSPSPGSISVCQRMAYAQSEFAGDVGCGETYQKARATWRMTREENGRPGMYYLIALLSGPRDQLEAKTYLTINSDIF